MDGYQVVPEHVDDAADAASELAEKGAAIDVAGPVEQATAALPGSRAEGELGKLARMMRDQTAELADDTRSYGNNLSNAAEHYRAHEGRAAEALEALVADIGASGRGPG